jgi:hypothetical protein
LLIETADGVHFARYEAGQLIKESTVDGAHDAVAADVNGDRRADLVAVKDGRVHLWVNEGNRFSTTATVISPPGVLSTNFGVQDLEVGDVDRDGNPDIHVVLSTSEPRHHVVGWLVNRGQAAFDRFVEVTSLTGRAAVNQVDATTGDFDHDQDLDVATEQAGELIWYENQGLVFQPQSITPHASFSSAGKISARDVDGQSGDELIVFQRGRRHDIDRGVIYAFDSVLDQMAARPDFAPLGYSALRLAFTDLDGDSDLDAVRAYPNQIDWFRNTDSTWANAGLITSWQTQTFVTDMAVGDLDRDGDADVVMVEASTDTITLFENRSGSFVEHDFNTQHFAGVEAIETADLNGDGWADFISRGTGVLWWASLPTPGTYAAPQTITDQTIVDLAIADLDGDADQDLVASELESIAWYENTGLGRFTRHPLGGASPFNVAVDFDSDGDVDVIAASDPSSLDDGLVLTYYENLGAGRGFAPARRLADLATGIPPLLDVPNLFVGLADLKVLYDPQQHPMVVGQFHRLGFELWGEIGVRLGSNGLLEAPRLLAQVQADDVYMSSAVGDLNADGRDDLIVVYTDDVTQMAWYEIQSNGVVEHRMERPLGHVDTLVDLDRDGDLDLRFYAGGWGENLGGEPLRFARHELPSLNFIGANATADVNRDGWLDLVQGAGNRLLWLPNATTRYDWNEDQRIDSHDVNRLAAAIVGSESDPQFDVNQDQQIDRHDLRYFLEERLQSSLADVNLDGRFDSSDLVSLFQAGKYSMNEGASWSEGDFDGDGFFTTSDLVLTFATSVYDTGEWDDD